MTSPLNPEMLSVLQDPQLRSGSPRPAQEIVDEIIDAVCASDDKPTLKSLATVARTWRPRSQRNLFHTYNLRISRVILTKAQAERQTSSLDDLFSHVRVLRLDPPRKVAVLMDSIWLLRLFTNVIKLELPYWNCQKVTVSQLAQLLGHFGSTVRGLKLAGIHLGRVTLMHLAWLLPLVNDINIRALYLAFDGSGPSPIEDRPPETRRVEGKLVIQEFEDHSMDFLDFLSDGSPSFHAITIVRCAPCEQSLRLINACGSTLTEFQYSTNTLSGISGEAARQCPVARYTSLSACTQLRILSIHLLSTFLRHASAWNLLPTIRSQHLAEIQVFADTWDVAASSEFDWSGVDEELCRLSDQSVEALHPLHVRVFIAGTYLGETDTSVVLDHLNIIWPGFSEKGEVTLTSGMPLPTAWTQWS